MLTVRRPRTTSPGVAPSPPSGKRPVVVATLEAPLVEEAARLGVDTAVEAGQPLLVVNAVETLLGPCGRALGYEYVAPPDVEESLRAPAVLAHGLGVHVERFCIRSTNPVGALVEFVGERAAGLLVLGPDPARISARRYRRAARKVCDEAPCLVWLAAD
jgi:nucleotide-binding universal stress UspA family protein